MQNLHKRKAILTFTVSAAVCILSAVYLLIVPGKVDYSSVSGSISTAILLCQIRNYAALPLLAVLYAGKNGAAFSFPQKVRRVCLAGALLMAVSGAYWTVGFICFQVNPPMSEEIGYYIMQNRYWIVLWWMLASFLLVCSMNFGNWNAASPQENTGAGSDR